MSKLQQSFLEQLSSHQHVFEQLPQHAENVEEMAQWCIEALRAGGKILLMGNGGSAADSQHLAAEFVVRFKRERVALPAIALTTDTSILTAGGNDYGFDEIFSRQVEALASERDIVIGISTSGNSANVNNALQQAKQKGAKTIAFTGRDGGQVKAIADKSIIIAHPETARIQEAHLFIGHWLCDAVDEYFAAAQE